METVKTETKVLALDHGHVLTKDVDVFRSLLEEVDEKSQWCRIKGKTVRVEELDVLSDLDLPDEVYEEARNLAPYALSGTYEDVLTGRSEDRCFVLRRTAVEDLFSRACESKRAGITVLPDCLDILTRIYQVKDEQFQALIRNGRLAALHTMRYAPIMQSEIYGYVENDLLTNQYEGKFIVGEYTIDGTVAYYEITDESLLSEYRDALQKNGLSKTNQNPHAGIRVSTSDVGVAGVRISPYIKGLNSVLQLPGQGNVRHYGTADIERVQKSAEVCFARYTHGIDDLIRLMKINLKNPAKAIIAATTRLRFPTKETQDAVDAMERNGELQEGMTAYEAYEILNILISRLQTTMTNERRFNLEESVYLAINYDWKTLG